MLRASVSLVLASLASCGSPPPGSVDEELLLVDLAACARGDTVCQKSGDVAATEALSGESIAVRLGTGGSISLPVSRAGARKLAWIAIGLRAADATRHLSVALDGAQPTLVGPGWGWARVEIAQANVAPAVNARLRLTAEQGTFDLLWVVGRFRD